MKYEYVSAFWEAKVSKNTGLEAVVCVEHDGAWVLYAKFPGTPWVEEGKSCVKISKQAPEPLEEIWFGKSYRALVFPFKGVHAVFFVKRKEGVSKSLQREIRHLFRSWEATDATS